MLFWTEDEMEQIRQTLYERYDSCAYCQPHEGKNTVWLVPKHDLGDALLYIIGELGLDRESEDSIEDEIEEPGIDEETEDSIVDLLPDLISKLELSCPTCSADWNDVSDGIGLHNPNQVNSSDEMEDYLYDDSDDDELDASEQSHIHNSPIIEDDWMVPDECLWLE